MTPEIQQLLEQKLEAIVRDETAELAVRLRAAHAQVAIGPDGMLQPGTLLRDLQSACYRTVIERGQRVAAMLGQTLRTVKVPYRDDLGGELAALVDPLFPEDLHLGAVLNAPEILKRRGLPLHFDERAFEDFAGVARGAIANAAREARGAVQIAIDEYLLCVKPETAPVSGKGLAVQAWDSLALKPGVLGFSVDLKKLFGAVLDLKKLFRGKSQL